MTTIVGSVLLLAVVILLAGFLWLGISLLVGLTVTLTRGGPGPRSHPDDDRCDICR